MGQTLACLKPAETPNGVQSKGKGNKKSLLIGINYIGQSAQLNGCINDVKNVKELIVSKGFFESPSQMRVLTDDSKQAFQPTKGNIIEGM